MCRVCCKLQHGHLIPLTHSKVRDWRGGMRIEIGNPVATIAEIPAVARASLAIIPKGEIKHHFRYGFMGVFYEADHGGVPRGSIGGGMSFIDIADVAIRGQDVPCMWKPIRIAQDTCEKLILLRLGG